MKVARWLRGTGIVGILIVLFFFISWFYLNEILHDGHMHFPSRPVGIFKLQPHQISVGAGRGVQWELFQKCENNEFEIVTADYVEDASWTARFGSSITDCVGTDSGGSVCTAPMTEKMLALLDDGHDLWFVAKGFVCQQGVAVLLSEKLIIKGN